jgi:hypothetical protein
LFGAVKLEWRQKKKEKFPKTLSDFRKTLSDFAQSPDNQYGFFPDFPNVPLTTQSIPPRHCGR